MKERVLNGNSNVVYSMYTVMFLNFRWHLWDTQDQNAVEKWTLTTHLNAAVVSNFREINILMKNICRKR